MEKYLIEEVMLLIGMNADEIEGMPESDKYTEASMASYFECSRCGCWVHHSDYSTVDGDVCDECNPHL